MVRFVLTAILILAPMTPAPADERPFDFPRMPGPTVIGNFLTTDGKTVWTLDHDAYPALIALDATGGVLYTTEIEGISAAPEPPIFAGGSVWIPDSIAGKVHQVDAATGEQLKSIGARAHSRGIAVLDGSVWVGVYGDAGTDWVVRYDPVTGAEQARIEAPDSVFAVLGAGGYVWINTGYALARIDPATNQLQSGPPGEYDYWMWAEDDLLIATSMYTGVFTVIDPEAGTVLNVIDRGHGTADLAVHDGSMWLPSAGRVERIDLTSGETVTEYTDPPVPLYIEITGNVMWLVNTDDAAAHEVQWFAMPGAEGTPRAVPEKVRPQKPPP